MKLFYRIKALFLAGTITAVTLTGCVYGPSPEYLARRNNRQNEVVTTNVTEEPSNTTEEAIDKIKLGRRLK